MGAEAIERADGDIRSYGRSLVGAAVPSGPSITGVPPWSPSSVMAAPCHLLPCGGEGYSRSDARAHSPLALPSSAPVCALGHLPPGGRQGAPTSACDFRLSQPVAVRLCPAWRGKALPHQYKKVNVADLRWGLSGCGKVWYNIIVKSCHETGLGFLG